MTIKTPPAKKLFNRDLAFAKMELCVCIGFSSGIISASANVVPERFVALYENARAGRWEEAFLLQKDLYPLTHALFLETNPAPVKFALEHLGHVTGSLRLPLVRVGRETEEAVIRALRSREATL